MQIESSLAQVDKESVGDCMFFIICSLSTFFELVILPYFVFPIYLSYYILFFPILLSPKDSVERKLRQDTSNWETSSRIFVPSIPLSSYPLSSSYSLIPLFSSLDFTERENFVKLYYQLGDVDGVLGKFEELLSNFQRDLRSISSEIRNLQSQTMSMNMKLRNRKVRETNNQ
jgi:hypothetical protein